MMKQHGGKCMVVLALVALLLVGACFVPVEPWGTYGNRYVATDGPVYLQYKDGNAYLVVRLGDTPSDGFQTNFFGTYKKERGKWILTTLRGDKSEFVSRLFWIRESGDKEGPTATYPRSFGF